MKRWLKGAAFAIGIVALLYIVQFQFMSNDSWSTWSLPLSGKVIVVDPGHGGIDGGATSKDGALEKDISLEIGFILRDYLQEAGAIVLMTREEDVDLAGENTHKIRKRKQEDLKRRADIINESDADLFLSLHLNAIPSPKWSGAQVFYQKATPGNEELAKFVQDELTRNLENTTRVAKPIQNVYLLKHATITGALVEAGFLSNPEEAELLTKPKYQEKIAASIYQGVIRYYTDEKVPVP
ncbi:N-acetylmuramoyl-L-alanine amidase CwlD [Alkalihalobacillus pseudalcaliphilus]|uniref:N-acetylmuramoyl-L-alanine amidase CwlD n=1 Tax=Alkalihalobacillus pseudalcaliphilus TaxID=79884 RepID=UPI00064DBB33|nr:N-acetylmuramoyl-L-alanine amidase CwlD [Alkalihalobacillus pseudalcaliphilus]KMK74919.1 N-acetylmuramoyl-L-alanine amidase [Alkalihalobacillus pseudalcaliphilus]